jgi:formate hydrogenlyase transcriptional activator
MDMVRRNEFRSDLLPSKRISRCPAPLRERRQDIALLVSHFVEVFSWHMGNQINYVPEKTLNAFTSYSLQGNVRELKNLMETSRDSVEQWSVSDPFADVRPQSNASETCTTHVQSAEWIIGGPNGAAERLRLKRTTLIAKMKKLGISRPVHHNEMNQSCEDHAEQAVRDTLNWSDHH